MHINTTCYKYYTTCIIYNAKNNTIKNTILYYKQ